MRSPVTIGGACGFWGDSTLATRQLLTSGKCDYLIYDGLAEVTMGILTRVRAGNKDLGYATHIIDDIASNVKALHDQGIRVVTNAGGINPTQAAVVIRDAVSSAGLPLRVASVTGDDLTPEADRMRASDLRDTEHDQPIPEDLLSLSAYLGARPIVSALEADADIVVTGRVADSAMVLGPLIHEFGWQVDEWDLLSHGSLAGHLIECGPQASGGLFTDWQSVPSWADIGYPIIECTDDGTFGLTKPESTGGLVCVAGVAEQLLYEIDDPANYQLPDVTCDWRAVEIQQTGENRVRVSGALGRPPSPYLKANAYFLDGATAAATVYLGGRDAAAKARRLAEEALKRIRMLLTTMGVEDLREASVEVLGAESTYGPHARNADVREVMLRIALHHDDQGALEAAVRELPSFGLVVPGFSLGGSGPPKPTPRMALRSFLVPRDLVRIEVRVDGEEDQVREWSAPPVEEPVSGRRMDETVDFMAEDPVQVPLVAIAHGRSGDKGPHSNIGIRARHPDFIPAIYAEVTEAAARSWLSHVIRGDVHRYQLPGIDAINLHLLDSLGGGGMASLRVDPQGKALAQQLLDMPVTIPRNWLDHPAILEVREVLEAKAVR